MSVPAPPSTSWTTVQDVGALPPGPEGHRELHCAAVSKPEASGLHAALSPARSKDAQLVVAVDADEARRQPPPLLDAVLEDPDPPLESLLDDDELLLDRPVLLDALVEPLLDVVDPPLETPVELELPLVDSPPSPDPPHAASVKGTRAARRRA